VTDKIAEVTPPPYVARLSSSGDDISIVTAHTDELALQVAALSMSPSRPRPPSRTRQLWGTLSGPDICWYHSRFKGSAKRCTAPCTWQQGNIDGSRLRRWAMWNYHTHTDTHVTYANNTLFLSVPTVSAAGRLLAASLYRVLEWTASPTVLACVRNYFVRCYEVVVLVG